MSIFNGVSTLLAGVFGDEVTVVTERGSREVIQAVFRRVPFPMVGEDGFVTEAVRPALFFDRRLISTLGDRFMVLAPDGNWYRQRDAIEETDSPAQDAGVKARLERCDAPE